MIERTMSFPDNCHCVARHFQITLFVWRRLIAGRSWWWWHLRQEDDKRFVAAEKEDQKRKWGNMMMKMIALNQSGQKGASLLETTIFGPNMCVSARQKVHFIILDAVCNASLVDTSPFPQSFPLCLVNHESSKIHRKASSEDNARQRKCRIPIAQCCHYGVLLCIENSIVSIVEH